MSNSFSRRPATAKAPRRASVTRRLRAALLATTVLSVTTATPAWALFPSWINPGDGDWFDPDNWNISAVPDSSTTLQVDNGGTAHVTNGGHALGDQGFIGRSFSGSGTVDVQGAGSSWTLTQGLYIGDDGFGTLTLGTGGRVGAGSADFGVNSNGTGVVTVDGAGSTLAVNNDLTIGDAGTGTLTITNGGQVTSGEAWIGRAAAGGTGTVVVDGAGSKWTNGDHMHLGTVGTGTLTIRNGAAVNNDDDLDIGANGTLNIGAAAGDPAAAAGTFDADQIIFHGGNAGLVFNHTDPNYLFSLLMRGDGTIRQMGPGTTVLTGNSSNFTGTTYVDAGSLIVDGSLGGFTYVTGILGGSGTIRSTRVQSGGTIAPGHNSVGTLTVAGSLWLDAGSTYAAELDASSGDLIRVALDAHLSNGALTLTGHPTLLTTYTILTTDTGAVYDGFGTVNANYAFIAPSISYDSNSVKVEFARNGVAFADIATNPNEAGAANAVEALGAGNSLYDTIVGLDSSEAQAAFDQLAGPPSPTQAADTQTAGLVSNILAGRIDQAFDVVGGGDTNVNNYVPDGPGVVADPAAPATGIWGQLYGASGSVASTGTVAGTRSVTGGLAMGLDGQLGAWRVGVLVQGGATSSAVPDLEATSASADYGAGLYAGTELGNTRLALGATYTRHSVSSSRHVVFPGVDETLSGSYASGTAQGFAQVSQQFDLGATSLTPYAGVQYVVNSSDGYTETGGAAALTVAPNLVDATFTTLGLSASRQFVVGGDKLLTAEAGVGWRHAFAGTPSAVHKLAGGTGFTVLGAPIAGDVAVLDAGLNLDVSDTTTFNLSYDGQLGTGMQTHGVKATWNSRF